MWDLIVSVPDHCLSNYLFQNISMFRAYLGVVYRKDRIY